MRIRNAFGFFEDDVQRNTLVKKLGGLLPTLDHSIEWVDYIPGTAVRTNTPLIVLGYADKVKYVNVKGLSPFKMVNEVMNALDDYCPQVQFMTPRQLREIQEDLERLAIDRTLVTKDTLAILESGKLTPKDCTYVAKTASEMEILPSFFPDEKAVADGKVLETFLKTSRATFMDTQMLADMLKEMDRKRIHSLESDLVDKKVHTLLNVNSELEEDFEEDDELEFG